MLVGELVKVLSGFPEDEEVTILYPEDIYGRDTGVKIEEVVYITGSGLRTKGVFIKHE